MAKIKLVVSATIEETFSDFIISRKTKGLAEKTLQSYQSQFQAVARHMDVKMDIAMLQKADLDAMIISMRDASLSPNSINSYTRTLKSFFSWCNEQGIPVLFGVSVILFISIFSGNTERPTEASCSSRHGFSSKSNPFADTSFCVCVAACGTS